MLCFRRPMETEEDLLVFIWSSGPREFFDASPVLQPFSYFQYRVRAQNSKGSVLSGWASARTLQAKPKNMPPPSATPTGEFRPAHWPSWLTICACSYTVLVDRCILGSSDVESTRRAQWCDFPSHTGVQKTPAGPDAQLHHCCRRHRGGKQPGQAVAQ